MEAVRTEILVVEDDIDLADHLCAYLEQLGYTVAARATRGEEAVALARDLKPQLVIMDIVLEGEMDGIEAAQAIVSSQGTPVIYTTSYDDATFFERARCTVPCAYLLKPYHDRELSIAIETALYRRARQMELEEVKCQLLQSEKLAAIGQLAAGVAHEINNPVGYINSNLGALEKYLGDLFTLIDIYKRAEPYIVEAAAITVIDETKRRIELDYLAEDICDLVKESQEGIDRVTRIIQDLKDFSRAHTDEWVYADIHSGLDSTLNIAHNEIKYKAEVIKHYGALPQIECIPSQLNQVFMNLLVNAAHAIEERGIITITTDMCDSDHVQITVTDSGTGIAPEILEKIFKPFFSTKPAGKGTGLGLSLACNIIAKHKGTISVDSTPGIGTTFMVRVPVVHTIDPTGAEEARLCH